MAEESTPQEQQQEDVYASLRIINKGEFDEKVLEKVLNKDEDVKTKLKVVYFSAISWCPPCTEYAPQYKELAENPSIKKLADLYIIDNDDYPDAEQDFEIDAFPTIKFFKDG